MEKEIRNETLQEALSRIQKVLKAPKNQTNNFGGYKYRSCEDILEAVKPELKGKILTISDEIVMLGDRYYVKATASIGDSKEIISTTAYARESLDKKGMDSAQITGATSSYARKYALNGLFCIDDTKDADSTNTGNEDEDTSYKAKVDAINTIPELQAFYMANKGLGKNFDKYVTKRKKELTTA